MNDIIFALIGISIGIIPLILLRRRLNVLTLGEDEAKSMGVNTNRLFLYANRVLMMYGRTILADDVLDADFIKRVYNVDVKIETFTDDVGTHKLCIPINGGCTK